MSVQKTPAPGNSNHPSGSSGMVGVIAMIAGFVFLLVSVLSVLNTLFKWGISFKGVPLPDDWDATIGLIGVTVIYWAFYLLLTYVPPVRNFGRKHPWITTLFVVGLLVGAIIVITIIDNANIQERSQQYAKEMAQDSLKRIEDSKAMFGDAPIPYRLAIFNPEPQPLQVKVDTASFGTIMGYKMLELQLPWKPFKVTLQLDGKDYEFRTIRPDSTLGKDPAALHVYNPRGRYDMGVFDHSAAYTNGTLDKTKEADVKSITEKFGNEFFDVEDAGPFYVMANEQAPPSTKYKVFRMVLLPEELRGKYDEVDAFVKWVCHRIDNQDTDSSPESPADQYKAWLSEK